jgi:hypothetical protein
MNHLRLLAPSFCLILVTSLLSSCVVSPVSVPPTAEPVGAPTATPESPTPTPTPPATPTSEPTATPEPAAATPAPTEGQIPTMRSEVPRISPEELKARLDNGEAIVVVDARTSYEFETAHIAGAISVPSFEVASRLDEFPRDQDIVFY